MRKQWEEWIAMALTAVVGVAVTIIFGSSFLYILFCKAYYVDSICLASIPWGIR
jgi:succinate dehydrogenase hydrophobic anchor subunit